MTREFSYYEINKLLWRWRKRKGARIVHEASLSMEKAPPPFPIQSGPRTPRVLRQPRPEPVIKMVNDIGKAIEVFSRFKKWLDTPDPPKPPKASRPTKPEKTVPPFDIQEIPKAMRKEHMPIGAKLMERWFSGRLNYSSTDADEQAEIDQDGKPYPPDMYDTSIVTLDWVLKFARAREKYEYLIKEAIYSPQSLRVLRNKLILYKDTAEIHTARLCANDPCNLHKLFQFQLTGVDGTLAEKIAIQLRADIENFGTPDDLMAALGSFNFYAAIGHVRFSSDIAGGVRLGDTRIAELTGIWVYVKDHYTFSDLPGERSQYLGHWSSEGVIVIPLDSVAALSSHIPYVESPVTIGNPIIKDEVHYPIHNRDFRQWAIRHQRGGDFVVFSDRRYVPIFPPVRMYL